MSGQKRRRQRQLRKSGERLAEDVLRVTQERYGSVVTAMAEGVVVQDASGAILACNPSTEQILGLTAAQMQGRTSVDSRWRAIHEDGSPFPGESHPAMLALRTGEPQKHVCMGVQKPDGTLSWILINSQPIFHVGSQAPSAVVTTFTDITELRRAEEAVRTSEERFRVALQNSPIVVFNQDRDLRYTWVNSPVAAWKAKGWLGKTDAEIVEDAKDAARLTAIKGRILETGQSVREEIPVRFQGQTIYYDFTGEPLRDRSGHVVGITCAVLDITERRHTEEEIKKSKARLQLQIDRMPIGCIVLSRDCRVMSWNPAAERIFGFTAKEALGRHPYDFIVPEGAKEHLDTIFSRLLEGDATAHSTNENLAKDGRLITCQWTNTPLREPDGTVVGVLSMVDDITERTRAENEIRTLNAELERRVLARTAELQVATDELQRVMASISDYLWSAELDEQGNWQYRYYSPGVERITGRPPSFYLQDSARWLETIHADDRSRLVRAFQRVTSGESEREEEEYRIVLPDGKIRWVRDCATVTRSGRRMRVDGVVSDVTERKKEELELRKFVSLADNSGEFIGICDMNFMPFYANQAALKLVGLDNIEQALRTPVPDFFFPEDQHFITEEFFPRVVREGRSEVEIRFRHFKTGRPVWMIYNVFHIKDAAGQPIGLATVSRDITARREAEEKLRESEATLRALLDTAAQAVLTIDSDGTIVSANRMAAAMFGYEPGELLGKSHDILVPERLREQHAKHRAEFVSKPITRPMGIGLELQAQRKDGSVFPVEVSLSGVHTSRGPLAVSFVSDITERKRAEGALRKSERQLRVLAGSLLTAQEDERRRLSRELHDDITQRLAFLSIELGKLAGKTPVSPKETQAIIQSLQDQTLRAVTEVRRISHGLHPSAIEDIGLAIALEEFCGEFEKAQDVQVRFDGLIDDSRLDHASATCLYRITQESLRNAVKHGRATEVQVSLSLTSDSVQLRIRDNGTGFSADSVRSKAGLGVVGMRERIRLVSGELTISSQPGQGTEVIASVPLIGVGHEKNSYSRG